MIVDQALYRGGRRQAVELDGGCLKRLEESAAAAGPPPADRSRLTGTLPQGAEDPEHTPGDARADARAFVWVGLQDPTEDELRLVEGEFGLHKLAVEDALSPHQRPKVEPYANHLFLVVKTLWYVDNSDAVETGQVSLFIGENYVVTIRHGEGTSLTGVRRGLDDHAEILGHGPTAVVHRVIDRIVDEYELVTAELEIDVDEVEASVFSETRTRDSERIYRLKRELAEMRRAVQPLRLPMQHAALAKYPFIHIGAADYFRDVTDHLARVSDTIDSLDGLLSTALDAHLARISVEQNDDMRRISAWVAIAAVGTLVAGIYGMNFDDMPELSWRFGYAWALGLMIVPGVVLYRLFKKSGWL